MSIKPLILCCFIILLFSSCANQHTKEHLREINAMSRKLNSAKTSLKQLDVNELQLMNNEIAMQLKFVNTNHQFFIMDSLFVQQLGLYAATGKTLSRILRNDFKALNASIIQSSAQLSKLKHDIKKQFLPQDSIAHYIITELSESKRWVVEVETIDEAIALQYEAYKTTKDPVDRSIMHVKKMLLIE